MDVNRDDGASFTYGVVPGGVVVQPEVAAEPDDGGVRHGDWVMKDIALLLYG